MSTRSAWAAKAGEDDGVGDADVAGGQTVSVTVCQVSKPFLGTAPSARGGPAPLMSWLTQTPGTVADRSASAAPLEVPMFKHRQAGGVVREQRPSGLDRCRRLAHPGDLPAVPPTASRGGFGAGVGCRHNRKLITKRRAKAALGVPLPTGCRSTARAGEPHRRSWGHGHSAGGTVRPEHDLVRPGPNPCRAGSRKTSVRTSDLL